MYIFNIYIFIYNRYRVYIYISPYITRYLDQARLPQLFSQITMHDLLHMTSPKLSSNGKLTLSFKHN